MIRRRVFDWRLVLVLCLFSLICYMFYVAIHSFQEIGVKDQQIAALIANNEKQFKTAKHERKIASEERKQILDYSKRQAERLSEILVYLNNHHFKLPQKLIKPIHAPNLSHPYKPVHHSGGGHSGHQPSQHSKPPKKHGGPHKKPHKHKSHHSHGSKHHHKNHSPGHSGSAPGHNKHHKHHKHGKGHRK